MRQQIVEVCPGIKLPFNKVYEAAKEFYLPIGVELETEAGQICAACQMGKQHAETMKGFDSLMDNVYQSMDIATKSLGLSRPAMPKGLEKVLQE